MASLTLYGPRTVPFTVKVERALRFKGLDYVVVEPQSPEDYRRWNPETGLLPLLEDGRSRVHDSTAILEYLDEAYPDPPLLSSDPKVAEAQRRLEDWCDESFLFYYLRWLRLRDELAAQGPRPFGPLAWLRALARGDGPAAGENPVAELVVQFGRRCDDLVNLLGNRPFFYADRPSMADLSAYSMLKSLQAGSFPSGSQLLNERPVLLDLLKRVEEATGG